MSYQPKVSIIIPTYNQAQYLKSALASVCAQSFEDWEIIIINNYSTDNTEKVIESFNEPRIRLERYHNNGVIASSRNLGIKLSNAKYIAFLDSDDRWYPSKLEESIVILDKGYDVVCNAENWVRDSLVLRTVKYGPIERAKYNSLLFSRNCLSTSATVK